MFGRMTIHPALLVASMVLVIVVVLLVVGAILPLTVVTPAGLGRPLVPVTIFCRTPVVVTVLALDSYSERQHDEDDPMDNVHD
jgi:hypothetical protein